MTDVLVLNKGFNAIQISDWQKAMSLLYQGHAEAVDENYVTYDFDSWAEISKAMAVNPSGFVHTPTLRLAIPSVIRLTRYEKLPSSEVKFTRRNIYDHYDYTCCYCGKEHGSKNLNLDHVVPRSRGGKTTWDNIVLSCIDCNRVKADRTPREAGMKMLVSPSRPRWKGATHMLLKSPIKIRVSWQRFIDKAYWDVELESDKSS